MKTFVLDASHFSTLKGFYLEARSVLTNDFVGFGNNLDAFNDILRGGFGKSEYGEAITLVWRNSAKSMSDLGWSETIKYVQEKLKTCHPSNMEAVRRDLESARMREGQTLFDIILDIIRRNKNVTLVLS